MRLATTSKTERFGSLAVLVLMPCLLLAAASLAGPAWAETVFRVTKTADTADGACDGDCSLREAIIAANGTAGADTITVPAGTYTLTLTGAVEDLSARGDLDIRDDLAITGAGKDSTTIDGNKLDRAFQNHSRTVKISGMTVKNGKAGSGGALYNLGTAANATFDDVRFTLNEATGDGGAIYNDGTITGTNSEFSNNKALGSFGGAITQYNSGATLVFKRTSFDNNSAPSNGGAINMNGWLGLYGASFTNNTTSGGSGGGVLVFSGHGEIKDSTFAGNHADTGNGGGLYFGESWNIPSEITNSTFSGNAAGNGGGIHGLGGSKNLTNVTVAGNTASSTGGGGGISGSAGFSAKNSIFSNNRSNNTPKNCDGGVPSRGRNLSSDATCFASGGTDLTNTDPKLHPLQDNGGPTKTHALAVSSPAIDAGDGMDAPSADQRGISRPRDGDRDGDAKHDIGAFEKNPPNPLDDAATADEGGDPVAIDVLANDGNGDGDTLTIAGHTQPPEGEGSVSCSATECTFTPDADFNGETGFEYTITDGNDGTDTATVAVTVKPVNDPPEASDNSYTTDEDEPLEVAAPGVLANDTDPDDDPLIVRDADPKVGIQPESSPSHGTLTLDADGFLSYVPDPDFSGTDSFTYKAIDGDLQSEVATVSITVNGVNDPPTISNIDDRTIDEDTSTGPIPFTIGDVEAGADCRKVTGRSSDQELVPDTEIAVEGTGENCTVKITPAPDKFGEVEITVTADDGDGGTFSEAFLLKVNDVNDLPPDDVAPVTAATLSQEPNAAGWHKEDVTVSFEATDNEDGSGVEQISYSAIGAQEILDKNEPGNSATVGITAEGETEITYKATDEAGNAEEPKTLTVRLDKTAPEVTITTPTDDAEYRLEEAVAANYTCSDGGSGMDSCADPVPSGGEIDTGSVGPNTFTVQARDKAGNAASESRTYGVVYDFAGFFSPVNNPPTLNSVNAGRAIPVKFGLGGDQGLDIFEAGYPKSQRIECDSTAQVDGIEETVTAGASGLSYDPGTDRYNYVWKTDKAWAGSCRQLVVKLKDGTSYRATFQLK